MTLQEKIGSAAAEAAEVLTRLGAPEAQWTGGGRAVRSPVTGERTERPPPVQSASDTPRRPSTSAASARAEPILVCTVISSYSAARRACWSSAA